MVKLSIPSTQLTGSWAWIRGIPYFLYNFDINVHVQNELIVFTYWAKPISRFCWRSPYVGTWVTNMVPVQTALTLNLPIL